MNNMNSMKPYLTDVERAEKMEKLAGYKEAVEILDEYERSLDVHSCNHDQTVRDECESGQTDACPAHLTYKGYDLVKAAYPAAYAYIMMELRFARAHCDREIKAIYRYAMDRILSGDDPETVASETEKAAEDLRCYRVDQVDSDGAGYQDVPERPCSRDEQDAYFREIALYFTARAMIVDIDELSPRLAFHLMADDQSIADLHLIISASSAESAHRAASQSGLSLSAYIEQLIQAANNA